MVPVEDFFSREELCEARTEPAFADAEHINGGIYTQPNAPSDILNDGI